MFNQRNVSISSALVLASLLGVTAAHAQTPCPFTVESLQGSYAVIGTYGANVAKSYGIRTFDGRGNLTGTALVNQPTAGSTTGERSVTTARQVGTYTVNCDGTGVFTRIVTANGVATSQTDDFLITEAVPSSAGLATLVATALTDIQQQPSAIVAGGIFLFRSYTRLPTVPVFAFYPRREPM